MYVVLGATGHVGSATTKALLAAGQAVTAVVHDPAKGQAWRERGAEVVAVDIHDVDALRRVLKTGRRAFLLNPPAAPSTDTDAEERETVRCLLAALDGSGLEKVVAESTMGARPGEALGDFNVLYELEQGLKAQPIPCSIIRAAYYMSNWDAQLDAIRSKGEVQTMYPADVAMPMVALADLGEEAAALLMAPVDVGGTRLVEGPARCSSADVAAAFAEALKRPVRVVVTPRDRWETGISRSRLLAGVRAVVCTHDRGQRRRDVRSRVRVDSGRTSLL